MKRIIEDELHDAMNTLEVMINSEHQSLFLDVLNSYVRNKPIEKGKMKQASRALRTVMGK